jgi:hypothetical protein
MFLLKLICNHEYAEHSEYDIAVSEYKELLSSLSEELLKAIRLNIQEQDKLTKKLFEKYNPGDNPHYIFSETKNFLIYCKVRKRLKTYIEKQTLDKYTEVLGSISTWDLECHKFTVEPIIKI